MTPSVSDAAEAELVSAAQTYAENGGKDLGTAFLDEFERCIDLLCERPYLGMIWENLCVGFRCDAFLIQSSTGSKVT